MAANVAMTKKGFGEMAITGCLAGPVFNVLIGIGLSFVIGILNSPNPNATVHFSLYAKDKNKETIFNKIAVLPMVLLIGQLGILIMILVNGITNDYQISFKQTKITIIFYFAVIFGLVYFSISQNVKPPTD